MEWVTRSTCAAPVCARTLSMTSASWRAVVSLDCAVLYVHAFSSLGDHPSAANRPFIVSQVEPLLFQPCTNTIGSCAAAWAVEAGARNAASRESVEATRKAVRRMNLKPPESGSYWTVL